ncbi:hypothetical protein SAMN05421685_103241 [Thalassovita mediterranea]|nr:hypothetical protein SAMN05421685_103241 [Thalassovita mediterranea]
MVALNAQTNKRSTANTLHKSAVGRGTNGAPHSQNLI